MIIVLFLTLVFIFFYLKEREKTGVTPLLIFFISLFCLTLFSLEYSIRVIDFFNSDEVGYINYNLNGLTNDPDRFLWYLINYLILNFDFSLNGLALKLINIPISALALIVLYYAFDKDKKVFFIPVFLPYFTYVATQNLRDPSILLFSILSIFLVYQKSIVMNIFGLCSLALLYLLRPFAAFIVLIIIGGQLLARFIKSLAGNSFKITVLKRSFVMLLLLVLLLPIILPAFQSKIDNYYDWFKYTTGEGQEQHINKVTSDYEYATGNRLVDFGLSSIRFVVTPFPHSIFLRFLQGGSEWGIADDFVRFLSQVGYYLLMGYLLLNYKFLFRVMRNFNRMQTTILGYLIMYWPIYSFHLYGGPHQRLKLPFQIVIFIMVICIARYKKQQNSQQMTGSELKMPV